MIGGVLSMELLTAGYMCRKRVVPIWPADPEYRLDSLDWHAKRTRHGKWGNVHVSYVHIVTARH